MKFFLSYSRKDSASVESVAEALRQDEHEVFFDRRSIEGGE